MSRQNKVNPGMYTQRGRLAQDDVARELKKELVAAKASGNRGTAGGATAAKAKKAAKKAIKRA